MTDEPHRTQGGARRARRRVLPEDDYSDVAPFDEEIEEWAERERKRRQAWLQDPTEEEKRAWAHARRHEARSAEPGLATSGPTGEEIEEWAERERKRRQAWLQGPTEEEKRAWARSHGRRRPRASYIGPTWRGPDEVTDRYELADETVRRIKRETELASKGAWRWMMEAPYWYWAKLVDAGREWEEGYERTERPRRIRLYADY
jgi:hypothetical protein